ncbi:hypothetical protein NDU88_008069, partial [Pleurodeles waltl]
VAPSATLPDCSWVDVGLRKEKRKSCPGLSHLLLSRFVSGWMQASGNKRGTEV